MISNWANTLWMSFKVNTIVCQCHYTCISFYWSWYLWNLCTLVKKAWKDDILFIKCKLWMTFKILIQIPLVDNAQIWYYTLSLSLSLLKLRWNPATSNNKKCIPLLHAYIYREAFKGKQGLAVLNYFTHLH